MGGILHDKWAAKKENLRETEIKSSPKNIRTRTIEKVQLFENRPFKKITAEPAELMGRLRYSQCSARSAVSRAKM